MVGNKVALGLPDHYLARTGYKSQQTSEPEDPNRPNNLWHPVEGDHGAHGKFDRRTHQKSYALWADLNRPWLGLGLAALAGASFFFVPHVCGGSSPKEEGKVRRRTA